MRSGCPRDPAHAGERWGDTSTWDGPVSTNCISTPPVSQDTLSKRYKSLNKDDLSLPAYRDLPKRRGNTCDHCPSQDQPGMTGKRDRDRLKHNEHNNFVIFLKSRFHLRSETKREAPAGTRQQEPQHRARDQNGTKEPPPPHQRQGPKMRPPAQEKS